MSKFNCLLMVTLMALNDGELSGADRETSSLPILVAHRGASADAPENTLPAFRLAWEQGADAIEGDFFLTKDEHIVCLHDPVTERSASSRLVVSESPLDDLQQLDVGAWKGRAFQGTRIPTLEEVFQTVPEGKRFYIEIKCGPEIMPVLEKCIRSSGLEADQIVIISFDPAVIKASKTRFPTIEAFWLRGFSDEEKRGRKDPWAEIRAILKQTGADGFSCAYCTLIDESFVRNIRDLDLEFHVWTVNSPQVARQLMALGVDSITTDEPAKLRKALETAQNGE